jgi:coatomer protein complex subunit gamma
MIHPDVVTSCNVDLENLISDNNRSIATLAITTLLKTGNESSVDRLMKQITSFMSEISDEFKTVVVEAIHSVCVKFPRKHNVLMTFLSNMLREEGGFQYKQAIVNTIITIIEENPDVKESGLAYLCEFIEDCEHTELANRILHLLGKEGPRTAKPHKYIRFIYNRVLLEVATVRAAAVTSLAKFGASCDELLESVLVLLERCLLDVDDEVRDRSLLYLEVLKQKQKSLSSSYILNPLSVSVAGLERALLNYCSKPNETPFDMKSVPIEAIPAATEPKSIGEVTPGASVQKALPASAASKQEIYASQISAIKELSWIGPLFRSSDDVIELTESETEYVVRCIKHTFLNHMVFQFDITNTLNDQLLENVRVEMEETEGFSVLSNVPIPHLPFNQPKTTYTLVQLDDSGIVSGTFLNTLKFIVKDCDPNTGEPDTDQGYDDEYVLENVDVVLSDNMQRVVKPNFAASWEEIGDENQIEETFALSSMKDISDAVKQITSFLGMQPCERSDRVDPSKSKHTLLLAGVFRGGHDVLVRATLAQTMQVTMKMTVRSTDLNTCELVAAAIN